MDDRLAEAEDILLSIFPLIRMAMERQKNKPDHETVTWIIDLAELRRVEKFLTPIFDHQ